MPLPGSILKDHRSKRDLDFTRNGLSRKGLNFHRFSSQLFTIVCFGLTHALSRVFIFHIRS
jgi:hypothetical protein